MVAGILNGRGGDILCDPAGSNHPENNVIVCDVSPYDVSRRPCPPPLRIGNLCLRNAKDSEARPVVARTLTSPRTPWGRSARAFVEPPPPPRKKGVVSGGRIGVGWKKQRADHSITTESTMSVGELHEAEEKVASRPPASCWAGRPPSGGRTPSLRVCQPPGWTPPPPPSIEGSHGLEKGPALDPSDLQEPEGRRVVRVEVPGTRLPEGGAIHRLSLTRSGWAGYLLKIPSLMMNQYGKRLE